MPYKDPTAHMIYHQKYRDEHAKKRAEYQRAYYRKNIDRLREYEAKRRVARSILRKQDRTRLYGQERIRKYNMAQDKYDAFMLAQGGRCAMCGQEKKLVVEHDHKTGQIRGLVCQKCNTVLGVLDNQELVDLGYAFLRRAQELVG